MNLIIIIILAIVQGATEFLPISSSGHLVLLYKIFNIDNNRILLSVILHLATLVSVVIYYRKSIIQLIKKPFCHTNIALIISTIITCIIAIILKSNIEDSFSGNYLSLGFVITAIILLISQILSYPKQPFAHNITTLNISYPKSIFIGIAQGLACFPGISRSGSTIASGLILKCNKNEITEYSFLLSIPIIIASTILEISELSSTNFALTFSILELFVGFITAIIVGILSIKCMTKLVSNQKLYYFSFYLIIIAFVSSFV